MDLENYVVAGRLRAGRHRDRLDYFFAPDAEQDWVWITPGSVLATTFWLAASLGFRFYVVNFGSYEETERRPRRRDHPDGSISRVSPSSWGPS
jgi:hypothetical protein